MADTNPLPKKIKDPEALRGKIFRYLNAVAMLDDLRRFRRLTGWTVVPRLTKTAFQFVVLETVETSEEDSKESIQPGVTFSIEARWIHQNLWSIHFGGDRDIDKLRRRFLDRPVVGVASLALEINQIPKDPEPSPTGRSVWDILKDDDDSHV